MPVGDGVYALVPVDGRIVIGVGPPRTVMAAAPAFEGSALDVAVTVTVPAVTPVTLPAASTVATAGLLELHVTDLFVGGSAGSRTTNRKIGPASCGGVWGGDRGAKNQGWPGGGGGASSL